MSENPEVKNLSAQEIQNVLDLGGQTSYFNDFFFAVGIGDAVISLSHNGKQTLVLNASHNIMKTMAQVILESIDEFEKATGSSIMTTHEINRKLEEHQNE
jgi:hypothetical protein